MKSWSALSTWLLVGTLTAGALTACGDDEGGISGGDELELYVNPTQVTFASIVVGSHSEQAVTFRNDGEAGIIELRSIELEDPAGEISITKPEGLVRLGPGEVAVVTVNYDPTDSTSDTNTLVVSTNIGISGGGRVTVRVPIGSVASAGSLVALPAPVDFGDVEGGRSKDETVTLINLGVESLTITDLQVRGGQDGDFTMSFLPTLPAVLDPNGTLTFEVTYAPTNGNSDLGRVDVRFDVGDQQREIDPPLELVGREVGPRLVAFPTPVDFGNRELDVPVEKSLTLSNQGSRDLVIASIALTPDSSDTIVVTGFPDGGATVAPGGVLSLTVTFTPRSGMPQITAPIATLEVTSNDSSNDGVTAIHIFGRPESPILQVNPPDQLEFGFVAQNLTRERRLALTNAGSAPLTINAITLPNTSNGEYTIKVDESFGPTASSPTSAVIAPQSYKEITLVFKNTGGSSGNASGMVNIASNDGTRPSWDVNLRAGRTGAPTCDIVVTPLPKDYGVVPRGFRRSLTFNIINQGSGDCSYHSAFVNDCAGFFGFFGGTCADPNNTPLTGGNSNYYQVTRGLPAIQNGLRAGQSYDIEVTFTPPDTAPITGDEFMDYAAYLGVRVIDPYSATPTTPVIFPRPATGTTTWAPNLHAKSGIAQLAVLPAEVDFGLTTIGCHSQTITVTAYNVGTAPLDVTDIRFNGCSPEFKLKASPGLPLTLAANGSDTIDIVYVPQDRGDDTCSLEFFVADGDTPMIVVPIAGEGTFETEHTDTYTQTTGQDVDILFVVDDSGSMGEEQNNVASNFQSFISGATTWNNDYHIAVTTTDLEGDSGKFIANGGAKRIVTRTNTGDFTKNVNVGTNGSGTEQGLAAAQAALSLPNTADSTTACTGDGQCTAPEKCVDGFCGGPNRGFLREEAALEIVMVSDEEDQSPNDIAFYVNFFKTIKGFYNTNMMHIHSIVGDTPNGCGQAAPGFRYYDVSSQTGGATGSICNTSFASSLSSIGDIAFGLRTQFFLGRLPEPSTITVTVAGAGCVTNSGANWIYDALSNSVVFAESGGCMPQAGQQVQIHYSTICLLE